MNDQNKLSFVNICHLAIEALESDNPDIQLRAVITLRAVLAQHEAQHNNWQTLPDLA